MTTGTGILNGEPVHSGWLFAVGPASIRRVLNVAITLLVIATLAGWGDPDLVLDALWVLLAVGAFVFGLHVTIGRILLVTFVVLGASVAQALVGGVPPAEIEPLELAEWPLMIALTMLVAIMADQVSKAARQYAMLYRSASDRLITAHEEERASLARDLHDGVGQTLTAVVLTLDAAESALPMKPEEAPARIAIRRARGLAVAALDEARQVAAQLRPSRIHELGLGAALHDLAESAGLPIEVRFSASILPPGLIEPERQIDAYRIVQEAVSNASRHAHATHIWIDAEVEEGMVRIEVGDDGVGFDKPTARARMGLAGMKERAAILMGRLEIRTQLDAGTRIELLIPVLSQTAREVSAPAVQEGAIG
jgi:signal transduction histidine kinase